MIYLEKPNSNADCISGAPQGTLVVCDWPWVAGKGFQNTGELEFDLLNGQEEPRGAESLRRYRLTWPRGSAILPTQPQHLLNLFWRIFLSSSKNVGLVTLGVTNFMDLCLRAR